jgi:hypothetical protein
MFAAMLAGDAINQGFGRGGAALPRIRVLLTIVTLSAGICAPQITHAELNPPPPSPQVTPTMETPMRILRVRSSDPACQPDCPEWIAAEGKIEIGTAQAFARVIAGLGGRRLPVLVNSPGGSVADAMAMGRLIRARGLAVAVARTILQPGASLVGSSEARGAITLGAICNSACPLMLAGGVERYAGLFASIGVHHVTQFITNWKITRWYRVNYRIVDGRKEEISRVFSGDKRSETTIQQSAGPKIEGDISAYLKEMGIGPPLMDLIETTPTTGLHWLSDKEKIESRLITLSLSGVLSPIVVGPGANGLAGLPIDPLVDHAALIIAKGSWRFALPVEGRPVTLGVRFGFRRGGGVVEARLLIRDVALDMEADVRGRGFMLTLSPGGAVYTFLKPDNGDPVRGTIPRAQFCGLAKHGQILVSAFDGPATHIDESGATANPHEPPVTIDVGAVDGMKALLEEACP